MDTRKLILWLLCLIIAVLIGIEIVYKEGECCDCVTTYKSTCEDGRICNVEKREKENCCKCSFFKERFGIDLYSWRKQK